ncbi:hypothetical protein CBL_05519 [Carabus blaptoides fortunei]
MQNYNKQQHQDPADTNLDRWLKRSTADMNAQLTRHTYIRLICLICRAAYLFLLLLLRCKTYTYLTRHLSTSSVNCQSNQPLYSVGFLHHSAVVSAHLKISPRFHECFFHKIHSFHVRSFDQHRLRLMSEIVAVVMSRKCCDGQMINAYIYSAVLEWMYVILLAREGGTHSLLDLRVFYDQPNHQLGTAK